VHDVAKPRPRREPTNADDEQENPTSPASTCRPRRAEWGHA
jgi:hypothetical protein